MSGLRARNLPRVRKMSIARHISVGAEKLASQKGRMRVVPVFAAQHEENSAQPNNGKLAQHRCKTCFTNFVKPQFRAATAMAAP
jgi:hypothetical protein